jgi:hypothetical protein
MRPWAYLNKNHTKVSKFWRQILGFFTQVMNLSSLMSQSAVNIVWKATQSLLDGTGDNWLFLALWRRIKIWMFIIVWNDTTCNFVVRQQRLIGNCLPATSNNGNRKFLKKSSKYFRKHIYTYICVCVFVCVCVWWGVKCNLLYWSLCSLFAVYMFVISFYWKSIETDYKISSPVNFLEVNIFLLQTWFSSCSLLS